MKNEEKQTMPLLKLPKEILFEIFYFLPEKSLKQINQACRQTRNSINEEGFKKKYNLLQLKQKETILNCIEAWTDEPHICKKIMSVGTTYAQDKLIIFDDRKLLYIIFKITQTPNLFKSPVQVEFYLGNSNKIGANNPLVKAFTEDPCLKTLEPIINALGIINTAGRHNIGRNKNSSNDSIAGAALPQNPTFKIGLF